MKSIMCFGDSNTYGESPEGFGRYERHERWTGILQKALGDDYLIIEEGLNGRTTVWDDPVEGDKSGKRHLPMCLETHAPLDLVVLMLGGNDFKRRFSVTPRDIAWSVETLVTIIQKADNGRRNAPRILLVAPIPVRRETFLGEVFGDRREDSLRLGALYADVAARKGCDFMNAAEIVEPSALDGLHMDRESHKRFAAALEAKIRGIFS